MGSSNTPSPASKARMAGTERATGSTRAVIPPAIAGRWRAPGAKLGDELRVTTHPPATPPPAGTIVVRSQR